MGVKTMKTFIVLLLSAALVLGAPSDDGIPHQPRSASDEDYSSEDDASYSYEDYSSEEDYPEDDYSMDDYESDRSESVESEESSESAESAEARSDPIDVATLINANGRSMRMTNQPNSLPHWNVEQLTLSTMENMLLLKHQDLEKGA